MTMTCRVLPHESDDGPWNMAMDEALLESVAADPSRAIVRTYEWSVPTLSLGYFQGRELAEAEARWRSVPVVRRPTGGGALWHDLEVTYAVIVPGNHPAARPSSALYRAVHEAIVRLFQASGVPAALRGPFDPAPTGTVRPFLCFTDRDIDDIILDKAKIVGSAQRRRSGAVLQHGSVLLGRSPTTPELPGLANLANESVDPASWIEALRTTLPLALGLSPHVDQPRPEELLRAGKLRREVYVNPSWTDRR